MRIAAISFASFGIAATAQSCSTLTIDASRPVNVVEQFFATWNIDSSRNRAFFDINFSDPTLGYLASEIGGTRIRFGGSGNDNLYYGVGTAPPCKLTDPNVYECLNTTWWGNLVALSNAASSPLVVGLNIHPNGTVSPPKGPWDPTNAEALLQYAQSQGQASSIYGLELGNEQNDNMNAQQQAAALRVLSGVLDRAWDAQAAPRPVLLGPDTHSFRSGSMKDNGATLQYLQEYVNATAGILGAVTHHEYIEVSAATALNASFLDASAEIAAQVVKAVRSVNATIPIWAGEIGPHNGGGSATQLPNCGGTGACGRFGSTIWYADSMSSKATAGYAAYARQDFIGADYGLLNYTTYGPSTDYWLLAVWHAAGVGRAVLGVSPPASRSLRAYAFCGSAPATAVLVLLNLSPASSTCVSPPAWAAPGAPLTQYSLSPTDGTVTSALADLNGQTLRLQPNGSLPALPGKPSAAGQPVTLPAASVTLLVVPTQPGPQTAACAAAY